MSRELMQHVRSFRALLSSTLDMPLLAETLIPPELPWTGLHCYPAIHFLHRDNLTVYLQKRET